jgi:hypothetical protein
MRESARLGRYSVLVAGSSVGLTSGVVEVIVRPTFNHAKEG